MVSTKKSTVDKIIKLNSFFVDFITKSKNSQSKEIISWVFYWMNKGRKGNDLANDDVIRPRILYVGIL